MMTKLSIMTKSINLKSLKPMKQSIQILQIILLVFAQNLIIQAQNLVPNPSFEEFDPCPNAVYEISYCQGWNSYGGSSDYFNSCAGNSIVGVPYNFGGFQPAASGDAYCGIATYISPVILGFSNYREYIGEMLQTNLIIGTKYYVSLKLNCSNISTLGPNNCASNNIGVKFSNTPYNVTMKVIYGPQINLNTISPDTLNWKRVFGSFIADSAYKYIIIGNFFDYINTDTLILNTDSLCLGAYYYIDDVCVSTDSLFTANYSYIEINEFDILPLINIYPNPASYYLNIDFPTLISSYEIEIFDDLGRELLKQEIFERHSMLKINDFAVGLLFIKISFNNQFKFFKILKNKL
jgi:hypothetical protein